VLIVLVSLATIMMITAGFAHKVFADPLHCDQPGWPSCYSVGYNAGQRNSGPCPSGHSSEYCRGWDDATRGGPQQQQTQQPTQENFAGEYNAIQSILV